MRLVDSDSAETIKKIPPAQLPMLLRLLGSSAFLSDVLIPHERKWLELFLRQMSIKEKSGAQHFSGLGRFCN